MKIIFFGTSEFAVPALRALKNAGFTVSGVVSVPDQPAGRERILTPPPTKKFATESGIPVFQPASLKDDTFFEEFESMAPDLCVVAAYGKIIPERYLSIPRYGFLNIHPSLLPKLRGPTPIQSAILYGDERTGVTIMKVDAEMDHGPILKMEETGIELNETYQQLHDRLADIGARLLVEVIPGYIDGSLIPYEQSHALASFTEIRPRIKSHIDWSVPSIEVHNWIRALNPDPGTWTIWQGALMNIRSSLLTNELSLETPGTIKKIGNEIAVSTPTTYIILKRVQLEGKKETSAIEFSQGHPDFIGSELK